MAIDRRKRPLTRERGDWRDASLFIIATEGEKTEPRYFSLFKSSRVKLKILECVDGSSSPEGVLARISQFKESYHFGDGDVFWLVIDRDAWRVKTLALVHSECKRKQFNLLVSNPQFEVWLAFHYEEPLPVPCTKAELAKHLKARMGSYSKSSYPTDGLVERSVAACERAKAADVGSNAIWPDSPGSRVYHLIQDLHGFTNI
jgi:hypothetical protein